MAAKTNKYLKQSSTVYQHNGKMLADYFAKHNINRSELGRQLGVAPSTVMKYLESESLQFRILWSISLALNHNFIADLCAKIPIEIPEPPKDEKLLALEKELEHLNIELSVYKNIVGK
ncbi:MAG: hypothetical protein WCK78_18530 [Paludibacter sp.]